MEAHSTTPARIAFRPFEESDLPHVSMIISEVWWNDIDDVAERQLFGKVDFAHYYQRATWSRVAVVDGEPMGLVLVRTGQPELAHKEAWQRRAAIGFAAISAINPEGGASMERYLTREYEIDQSLLKESGHAGDAEIVLFAVSSRARGRGIGKALFDMAENHVRISGHTSAFLFTDTSCTWQFYEHRGLTRAAQLATSPEDRPFLCDEYYVYTTEVA